jgi:flagellar biosynthesis/type III secretory pathway protein FliH
MWATRRVMVLVFLAVLGSADAARAQIAGLSAGFQEGYSRGVRAGDEDGRRRESFNFNDEAEYRRADAGYRSQYGPIDRYRNEFRRGFEQGYRSGYDRYYQGGRGGYGGGYGGGYDGPPYGRGRGRGPGYGYGYPDQGYVIGSNRRAYEQGFNDGYEAGLDDGTDGRRFDPISEGRYRSGDRGYEREYGSREAYKIDYRNAFRQGYEAGYNDGRRYGSNRRWWNPFGN